LQVQAAHELGEMGTALWRGAEDQAHLLRQAAGDPNQILEAAAEIGPERYGQVVGGATVETASIATVFAGVGAARATARGAAAVRAEATAAEAVVVQEGRVAAATATSERAAIRAAVSDVTADAVVADTAANASSALPRVAGGSPAADTAVLAGAPTSTPYASGLSRPTAAQLELHQKITLRGFMEKVEQLDVSTNRSGAVFYSGPGNRELAERFAKATSRRTLEQTPGGIYLENQALFKIFPRELALKPWERLSERFAQQASGEANAFLRGARARGVFNRYELPALNQNPEVYALRFRY